MSLMVVAVRVRLPGTSLQLSQGTATNAADNTANNNLLG
jgi:hypothetical protein